MHARTVSGDRALAFAPDQRFDWIYAAGVPTRSRCDSAAWARACFEQARLPMRCFLVVGWSLLVLEGWPRSDHRHVLGWPVVARAPATVLRRRSRLGLEATLVFTVTEGTVTFASGLSFSRPVARVVWAAAAPVHRWVMRTVLDHAAESIGAA